MLKHAAILFSVASTSLAANAAITCSAAKMAELRATATSASHYVSLDCNATLAAGDVITKNVIIQGAASSGVSLNCQGAHLTPNSTNSANDEIEVRSVRQQSGSTVTWSRPTGVHISNCNITGSVRVWGMARNGEGADLLASSHSLGHTARAQAAAPYGTILTNLTVIGTSNTPIYLAPGSSYTQLIDSHIGGKSLSVAVYLDAESGHNILKNNSIYTVTGGDRELISLDGSAANRLIGNRLSGLSHGGIFLYRNCGEGGTVRQQTSSGNQLINNSFYYDSYSGSNPSVWVASRNGNRDYCNDDNGYPFGSSIDNDDLARYNVILDNQIYKLNPTQMIRFSETPNTSYRNITVSARIDRRSNCYMNSAYPSPYVNDGQIITKVFNAEDQPVCNGYQYTCNDGIMQAAAHACTAATPAPTPAPQVPAPAPAPHPPTYPGHGEEP